MILIGGKPQGKMPTDRFAVVQGRYDIKGRAKENLDTAEVARTVESFRGKVDAIAVSGYASVRNPAHEIYVKKVIEQTLEIPVACAHELTSSLGFYDRTVTVDLNARLIPLVRDLMDAVRLSMMTKEEDWLAHTEAAPIDICWQDWHLASPNNLAETKYALKAGSSRLGCFSTFVWEYPGYHDEKQRFSDMCRTMGILAAKKDEGMDCVTYPEDGMPGFFMLSGEVHYAAKGFGVTKEKQKSVMKTQASRCKFAAQILLTIICTINPASAVLMGDGIEEADLPLIEKECLEIISSKHIPKLSVNNNIEENYVRGVVRYTLDSMQYRVSMEKLAIKESVLMTCGECESVADFDIAREVYHGVAEYFHWKERGEILVPRVKEAGDVNHTDALLRARALGKEIG